MPSGRTVAVYTYLKGKRILASAMEAYGIPDPAAGSENLQIQRVVTAVHHGTDHGKDAGRDDFCICISAVGSAFTTGLTSGFADGIVRNRRWVGDL